MSKQFKTSPICNIQNSNWYINTSKNNENNLQLSFYSIYRAVAGCNKGGNVEQFSF